MKLSLPSFHPLTHSGTISVRPAARHLSHSVPSTQASGQQQPVLGRDQNTVFYCLLAESTVQDEEPVMRLQLQQPEGDLFPCGCDTTDASQSSSNDTPAPERSMCQPCKPPSATEEELAGLSKPEEEEGTSPGENSSTEVLVTEGEDQEEVTVEDEEVRSGRKTEAGDESLEQEVSEELRKEAEDTLAEAGEEKQEPVEGAPEEFLHAEEAESASDEGSDEESEDGSPQEETVMATYKQTTVETVPQVATAAGEVGDEKTEPELETSEPESEQTQPELTEELNPPSQAEREAAEAPEIISEPQAGLLEKTEPSGDEVIVEDKKMKTTEETPKAKPVEEPTSPQAKEVTGLRDRSHIEDMLRLGMAEPSAEFSGAVKKLLNIYHTAIKPMEQAFKYNELRQHEVSGLYLRKTM
ncbi:sarcalumenin [Austrofundulus limnaeus]|uniref:Sarcalumenin n=1 Tax=Austrofundulus limnaeus TaxID=52670 RepID=A0A2I4CVK7_AUSLI|nr:PREDICTED: sarcalumenin-like [Austrofundulus limnaeus]